MSYEPTIIIRKEQLDKIVNELEEEKYSQDDDVREVAEYLLQVSKYDTIKFGDLELVLCDPEFTSFNLKVRDRLDDSGIEYQTHW